MKKMYVVLFASMVVGGLLSACRTKENVLSRSERKQGWELLFNGKDLYGWIGRGDGTWSVDAEGNLMTENGDKKEYGYLCTVREFKDFDLRLEFKQESNGNSGVFFHSFIEGFNKVNGWQCEVAPKNNDTGGIYESYGRGWLQQIPDEKESVLREGEWNSLRLLVEGDHVRTWLNDVPMADLHDALIGSKTGQVMLQIHDGNDIRVIWRNIRIKTLSGSPLKGEE